MLETPSLQHLFPAIKPSLVRISHGGGLSPAFGSVISSLSFSYVEVGNHDQQFHTEILHILSFEIHKISKADPSEDGC
jgi:hypothetical protein